MYISVAGFSTFITENITNETKHLPVSKTSFKELLANLPKGSWTDLELRDGKAIEYVRVHNFCGKLVLQRGIEETKPLSFRCGTQVNYVLTKQGVKDLACQGEYCP